jgi:hypothetical protein
MKHETQAGSSGGVDGSGHHGRSPSQQSPLQTRAPFLKNRSWESIVSYNRGACERGGAQHGLNPEAGAALAEEWERQQLLDHSLLETFDYLKSCHRSAPFFFFNGNTFADISRQLSTVLFSELPPARRREIISAVAHYVAGVLDRDAMIQIVESLCESADYQKGDRIRTLRGSTQGIIIRILEDGKVVWKPDDTDVELTGLPETLKKLS